MNGPQDSMLAGGRRLHLNHGPIDLIVEAFGAEEERHAAYAQAVARFATILTELVSELPKLRAPVRPSSDAAAPSIFTDPTARRMERAVVPHSRIFITPMAAVAGAVADEVLAALIAGRRLEKAYVNNGGDIALHLTPGASIRAAIAGAGHGLTDRVTVRAVDPVRGIATSGWRGRSFSLGIADAVTVLARSAAEADAAATVIANAVDLPGHPEIRRAPANDLAPDSDLGDRLVTTGVGPLDNSEVAEALERGLSVAKDCRARGLIAGAALFLGGESRACFDSSLQGMAFLRTPLRPANRTHLASPPQGGDLAAARPSPASNIADRATRSKLPISPLEGEMAGGTEGCNVERRRRNSYRKVQDA